MSGDPADFADDLFLGCAFAAYVETAAALGRRPDPETVRRLAYDYYECELAARRQAKAPLSSAKEES